MTGSPQVLGDYLLLVRSVEPATLFGENQFVYVDISAIDREQRTISSPQNISTADAPSRARQVIFSGDVIVSTVRPNLNTVATVTDKFSGAIASTGFCVLRPRQEVLDTRFLFHWLSSAATVRRLVQLATGATYPAVSDRTVKSLHFKPPALVDQQRIATILDKIDSLRQKRLEAIRLMDDFLQTAYIDISKKHTDRASVESVLANIQNAARTGPFGSQLLVSEFTETGIPVLGIDNVVTNNFKWGARRFISPKKYAELERFTVRPGDVMVTIMGTTGRVAIAPHDLPLCISTKHLCTLSLDQRRMSPAYLWACLRWDPAVRAQTQREAKGAIMEGWNMGIVKGLQVSVPPIDVQQKFSLLIDRTNVLSQRARASSDNINALISSVASKFFGSSAQT